MNAPLTVRGPGASRPAAQPPEPEVLLLASGKGGQGTSTVAALLGIVAAAEGARVLLVDASGGARSLAALLGVPAPDPLARRHQGPALLEELLLPVSDTLALLSLGERTGDDASSAGERRAFFRWVAPLYRRFDLVVIDAGWRLESILQTAGAAARTMLVTGSDRVAVTATYALVKTLDARFPALPVELLLNGADAPAAISAFREIQAASQLFLQRTLDYAGTLPVDDSHRASAAAGIPVQQAPIDSPLVVAIHQLGARVSRELSTPRGG